MDEEEKTAALEESDPRPEKSGWEEQKEIDRKLDEAGIDPDDPILDDTKE